MTGIDAADRETTGAAMSWADMARVSREMLEQSFNEGKFALVNEFIAPDAPNHNSALPSRMRALPGPEVLTQSAIMYRAAFPDLRISVDDVISAEDRVVIRWHSNGTHHGELAGLAPTGARVTVTGMGIDRWETGKVVEAWGAWDNLGLARQVGAVPKEDTRAEKIGLVVHRLLARWLRRQHRPK